MRDSESGSKTTNPHYEEPSNAFFHAWAQLVLKYRWLFLVLMAALTAWSIVQIRTTLYVDNSVEAFYSDDNDTAKILEETRDLFGRDALFLVMAEGDVFSDPFLRRLERLHHELKALNLELPTLGERKRDRDSRRTCGTLSPVASDPDSAPAPAATSVATPTGEAFEDDDGFEEDPDEQSSGTAGSEDGFEGAGSIVEEIVSLINARHTWSESVGPDESPTLHVDKLMEPLPTSDQLARIKASTLVSPTLVGQVVDREGRFAILAIRTDFMSEKDSARVFQRVVTTIAKYNDDGFKLNVAGMPALAASLNRVMLRDLRVMLLFSVIGQFIILFWLFRHLIGVLGPIVVVVLAVIWSLGMMASFCMPMTMLTNIMPAFLVCVGIADAVHLQSVYRQARQRGLINHDAIVYAVSTTGMPVLFTTLTTMAGLLSFRFATVPAIGDMGTASAFGVLVAFVNSLVLLPVILSFNKKSLLGLNAKGEGKMVDPLGWVVQALARVSGSLRGQDRAVADRRRRWTLVGAGLLFAVCAYNASLLKVWHDPLSWIPGDRSLKQAFDVMDEHVGGTVSVLAVIKAKEGYTVKDRDILLGMEKLENRIREYRATKPDGTEIALMGNSISLTDLVKETHKAMVPDRENNYRIPDTQAEVSQFVEQFSMKAPSERKHIVSIDDMNTLMSLRMRWMEATSYGPFTHYVEEAAAKFIPIEKATVQLTGTIYSLFTTVSALIWNMMRSFGLAFCVITVLMVLTLRSFKLGLIAMVPNLLPIVCILGLMGATDIPIDMANLLIASIALGIAVDDTIHFLHHWRVHYDVNGDVDAAIEYSFDHSGRAMVSTTLILTMGFFVYLASSMAHMQRFGMLIGLTVIMALLIDLIVAPALLRSAFKNKAVEEVVDAE